MIYFLIFVAISAFFSWRFFNERVGAKSPIEIVKPTENLSLQREILLLFILMFLDKNELTRGLATDEAVFSLLINKLNMPDFYDKKATYDKSMLVGEEVLYNAVSNVPYHEKLKILELITEITNQYNISNIHDSLRDLAIKLKYKKQDYERIVAKNGQ